MTTAPRQNLKGAPNGDQERRGGEDKRLLTVQRPMNPLRRKRKKRRPGCGSGRRDQRHGQYRHTTTEGVKADHRSVGEVSPVSGLGHVML